MPPTKRKRPETNPFDIAAGRAPKRLRQAAPQLKRDSPRATAATFGAFATMMNAARKSNYRESFHLIADPSSNHWSWTWRRGKTELPDGSWSGEVRLKPGVTSTAEGGVLLLSTNVPSCPEPVPRAWSSVLGPTESGCKLTSSHLQSLLQKSVRRGLAGAAVRIAAELCRQGISGVTTLVRRLPILMVEDAILHPALPVVAWVMAAVSQGYICSSRHIAALLGIVSEVSRSQQCEEMSLLPDLRRLPEVSMLDLSRHGVRVALPCDVYTRQMGDQSRTEQAFAHLVKKPLRTVGDPAAGEKNLKMNVLPLGAADIVGPGSAAAALIRGLLLRAAFGGMKCDQELLLQSASLWFVRFGSEVRVVSSLHGSGDRPAEGSIAALPSSAGAGGDDAWIDWLRRVHRCHFPPHLAQPRSHGGDIVHGSWYWSPAALPVGGGSHDWHGSGSCIRVGASSPPTLTADTVPPFGIDFHVSNVLEDACERHSEEWHRCGIVNPETGARLDAAQLKGPMWDWWSSPNVRRSHRAGRKRAVSGESSPWDATWKPPREAALTATDAAWERVWDRVRPDIEEQSLAFLKGKLPAGNVAVRAAPARSHLPADSVV